MTQEERAAREFLKVRIDLPSFQFEVETRDPAAALGELRRILEVMHLDDEVAYEEFVHQELRSRCSEEFLRNPQVTAALRSLIKQEDDYHIATAEIPKLTALDLDAQTRVGKIARQDVKRAAARLTSGVECIAVKSGIIHIAGDIDRDGKVLIADHIHRAMPTAHLRAFHSRSPSGNVTVECIFFGDFPEDED